MKAGEPRLPLFVYGTLMADGPQGGMLGRLSRAPAKARGQLYRMRAGYPALRVDGEGVVHGELVSPPEPRVLALLDDYEGVSEGLYRRVILDVQVGLRSVAAWAWIMDDPVSRGGVRVPSGRWRPIRQTAGRQT